jgi:NAD dependent epimerase/dehydratase
MKVLVTGADGFIGSHLVEKLVNDGFEVSAFVYYNSNNSWGWLDSFSKDIIDKINIISGDIRDYNSVLKAVEGNEIIYHLAALIAIPYSYVAPDSYVQTNISGTLNVLMASKACSVKRVLITSTSEVYGTALYVPIDEKHPKQGQSPYSATKIGADALAESFYRSFNLPITIVRPFNTFGPRQSARAVIPTIITQLLSGSQELKLGALNPTRDLVYVKDTVNGFIEIARSEALIGQEVNIATNSEISIGEVCHLIQKIMGTKAQIISDEIRLRPEKSEVNRLFGDNSNLLNNSNWKQNYSFEEGLIETIDWMKKNLHYYKPNLYNV